VNKVDGAQDDDKPAPGQSNIFFTELKNTACGFDGTAKEDREYGRWEGVSKSTCKEKCLKKIENGINCYGFDYNEEKERCRVFYVYPFHQKSHDEVDCWLSTGSSTSIVYPTPSTSVNKVDGAQDDDKPAPGQSNIFFTELKNTACGFDGTAKEDREYGRWEGISKSTCKEKCLKKIENGINCYGFDYNEEKERCRVFYVYPFHQKSRDEVDCWLTD
jgi:hypothetical protein